MNKQLPVKPGTLLSPVPVALIGAGPREGEPGRKNLMAAAWVGTVCSDPPMVSVSIRPSRYTRELVDATGEFTVNLTDKPMAKGTDYCGVRSGREEDKFETCGWHALEMERLTAAPGLAESPLCLGCKVRQRIELGSHIMYIGEVVSMTVREDLMDEKGAIGLHKIPLLTYAHGIYATTAKPVGFFGWSVAAPDIWKRRMDELRGDKKK